MQVSERDWRLTFLPAFKRCVQAGSYSLMCSFNRSEQPHTAHPKETGQYKNTNIEVASYMYICEHSPCTFNIFQLVLMPEQNAFNL